MITCKKILFLIFVLFISCKQDAPNVNPADYFLVVPPTFPGTVVLQVSSVSPSGTNVPTNTRAYIQFNYPIVTGSVTGATLTVQKNAAFLTQGTDYTLSFSTPSNYITITFTPALNNGDVIDITTTAGILAQDNNSALTNPNTYSFTVAAAADVTAPGISGRSPAINATEIALNSTISITFDEAIDATTIHNGTLYLERISDGSLIYGTYNTVGNPTIIFTPTFLLPDDSVNVAMDFRVHATNGIKDLAGNSFAGTTWDFDVVASSAGAQPSIISLYTSGITTTGAKVHIAYDMPADYNLHWGTNDTYPSAITGSFNSYHEITMPLLTAGKRYYINLATTDYQSQASGQDGLNSAAIQFNTQTSESVTAIQGGAGDQRTISLYPESGNGLYALWFDTNTSLIKAQYYNSSLTTQWSPTDIYSSTVTAVMSASDDSNATPGFTVAAKNSGDGLLYAKRIIKGTGAIQGSYSATSRGFQIDNTSSAYLSASVVPVTKTLTHDRLLFAWKDAGGIKANVVSKDFHVKGGAVDSGTHTIPAGYFLYDASQNFQTTLVSPPYLIRTIPGYLYALVTSVNSNTLLTLSDNILPAPESYEIYTITVDDNGVTDGAVLNRLVDTTQNFFTTVYDSNGAAPYYSLAYRVDTGQVSRIENVLLDSDLLVNPNYFQSTGISYILYRRTAVIVESGSHTAPPPPPISTQIIESGQNFMSTVAVGDIVINTISGLVASVSTVNNNEQLTVSEAIMNDTDTYELYKKHQVDTGTVTSTGVSQLIDATKTWASGQDSVRVNDIAYNVNTGLYAQITAVGATTTLTLDRNIFTTVGHTYRIFRLGIAVNSLTITATGSNPKAISDGSGNALIVYEDTSAVPTKIKIRKINSDGTTVWGSSNIDTANVAQSESILKVESDAAGGAVVLYKYNNNLYAQRINAAGAVQWTAGGRSVETGAATTSEEDMVFDSANNGVIVAARTNSNDIWVFRTGTVTWAAAYNPALYGSQRNPKIHFDGTNLNVFWEDNRFAASVGYGIFGIKLNLADGSVPAAWNANSGGGSADTSGVAVILNSLNKTWFNSQLIRYGATNFFLGFEDYRDAQGINLKYFSQDAGTWTP